MGSPGRHSRGSSSTRYSGSLKPDSHKSGNGSRRNHQQHQHHRRKSGKEFDAIEEEGLLDEEGGRRGVSRRCYVVAFVVGFFVLFSFFALILWGASRNQKPVVTLKTILFDDFMIHAGSDSAGVGTEMVTMNSTVKLILRNTGTFFGIHVSPTPLDLFFYELTLASGTISPTTNVISAFSKTLSYCSLQQLVPRVPRFYPVFTRFCASSPWTTDLAAYSDVFKNPWLSLPSSDCSLRATLLPDYCLLNE